MHTSMLTTKQILKIRLHIYTSMALMPLIFNVSSACSSPGLPIRVPGY